MRCSSPLCERRSGRIEKPATPGYPCTNSSLWINVQTLKELRESSLVPIRTISMMLTALGSLALLMASVGGYAVLAYAVSQGDT